MRTWLKFCWCLVALPAAVQAQNPIPPLYESPSNQSATAANGVMRAPLADPIPAVAPSRIPLSELYVAAPADDKESKDAKESDEKESKDAQKYLSESDVEKIVADYLKKKEEKKAAEEKEKADEAKAKGYEVGTDLGMTATWKDGLEISSKNKDFRVHVGGRYQFDTGWFSPDPAVQNNLFSPANGPNPNSPRYADGVDFRRARFRIDGTMYELIDWAAEIDFVNSFRTRGIVADPNANRGIDNTTVALTDFWWQLRSVPCFGTVRIGQQKEPIGFEHLVSSRFLPFMERSYNQDTFYGGTYNGFSPGIAAFRNYGADEMGVIHYGLYKPVDNVFGYNTGDGDYAVTGRITRLLWYVDEGHGLLHVGLSGRQGTAVSQSQSARNITFRTRDAIRTGLSQDWSVPAGITLFGDDMQTVNSELVGVYGPWTFQSEYLVNSLQDARVGVNDPTGTNAVYHGGYVQLLYFLTGEHDHYSKANGAFERVRPRSNFFVARSCNGATVVGPGAWQVGARYNYLDLNDGALNGGMLHNMTFGLNWFWNPNMKAQFNYIGTYRDASDMTAVDFRDGSGWIHGWGTRIACDF